MPMTTDSRSGSVEVGGLMSVAAAVAVHDGTIVEARLALDGTGADARRTRAAERVLLGAPPHIGVLAAAARAAITDPFAERAIVRLLLDLTV
jgi:xanthine dehydrogenase YagS FAD-binding subunit